MNDFHSFVIQLCEKSNVKWKGHLSSVLYFHFFLKSFKKALLPDKNLFAHVCHIGMGPIILQFNYCEKAMWNEWYWFFCDSTLWKSNVWNEKDSYRPRHALASFWGFKGSSARQKTRQNASVHMCASGLPHPPESRLYKQRLGKKQKSFQICSGIAKADWMIKD